ncbi:hypothetical protein NLM24_04845 [Nocardia zapadnayensis]|nr:hypothetical protein [Nocardia zapadnayensis]MCX0270047.1 hypothetical protein [Nocardia zapadnayensis]
MRKDPTPRPVDPDEIARAARALDQFGRDLHEARSTPEPSNNRPVTPSRAYTDDLAAGTPQEGWQLVEGRWLDANGNVVYTQGADGWYDTNGVLVYDFLGNRPGAR